MTEIYYAPTKKTQPITLAQLQQRLTAAGLPCTIEADSADTHWLVFEPHESTIYASTTGDHVTLATLEFGANDDTRLATRLRRLWMPSVFPQTRRRITHEFSCAMRGSELGHRVAVAIGVSHDSGR